jgi:TonB family protein
VTALLIASLAAVLQAPGATGRGPVRLERSISGPRRVKSSSPEYPTEAVQAGLQGAVVIECTVGTDGKVREASALRGEAPLTDAAVRAVKKWRYEPLLLDGTPTEFILTVTVNFTRIERVTVDGLCDSLRSRYEAVRESAATLLGQVRSGRRIGADDVAQARRELKALLTREQVPRVREAAEKAVLRLEGQ